MIIKAKLENTMVNGRAVWTGDILTGWYFTIAKVSIKMDDGTVINAQVAVNRKGRIMISKEDSSLKRP